MEPFRHYCRSFWDRHLCRAPSEGLAGTYPARGTVAEDQWCPRGHTHQHLWLQRTPPEDWRDHWHGHHSHTDAHPSREGHSKSRKSSGYHRAIDLLSQEIMTQVSEGLKTTNYTNFTNFNSSQLSLVLFSRMNETYYTNIMSARLSVIFHSSCHRTRIREIRVIRCEDKTWGNLK